MVEDVSDPPAEVVECDERNTACVADGEDEDSGTVGADIEGRKESAKHVHVRAVCENRPDRSGRFVDEARLGGEEVGEPS